MNEPAATARTPPAAGQEGAEAQERVVTLEAALAHALHALTLADDSFQGGTCEVAPATYERAIREARVELEGVLAAGTALAPPGESQEG